MFSILKYIAKLIFFNRSDFSIDHKRDVECDWNSGRCGAVWCELNLVVLTKRWKYAEKITESQTKNIIHYKNKFLILRLLRDFWTIFFSVNAGIVTLTMWIYTPPNVKRTKIKQIRRFNILGRKYLRKFSRDRKLLRLGNKSAFCNFARLKIATQVPLLKENNSH